MCGIAGFVVREGHGDKGAAREVIDRMCRVIAHRGPDDQGMFVEGEVALGMRRLSIIDVASGHQPMSGCDGAVTIVFNGEIYNHRDLQRELKSRGHHFRTHSDTETIIHAYEAFGARCVDSLRGMFALAIWDARKRELFVARDRVGKKPLYYSLTQDGTFIFGSELKSLREHPDFRGEINVEALDAYLSFGYVPDPLTIFHDVHKLPPGHYLKFKDGRIRVERYWDFSYEHSQSARARGEDELIAELRALLDEAVRVRLESEVPLGAFLSGGVDSSVVVGLMSRHASQPVKTFSIGFHEDSYDELKYARVAADHFQTDHHEFIVTPDVCAIVDELVWHFDEPFADSSAIPTYYVSRLAREFVTVALSGDGGDELFAGYNRYSQAMSRGPLAQLPRAIRKSLQPMAHWLPHGAWGRNHLHWSGFDFLDAYIELVSQFTRLSKLSLYSESFRAQLLQLDGPAAMFREIGKRVNASDDLESLLYLDAKTYLPGDILTKVDRMSMAVSLEARAPLLDHKLIEFVTRIPSSLKLRGNETKYILKRAVQGLVPDEILNRPKMGFGLPVQEWINHELRTRIRETLTSQRASQRGYFDQRYIGVLLDEHEHARRDHSARLWTLFMLELWHERYVDCTSAPVGQTAELVYA